MENTLKKGDFIAVRTFGIIEFTHGDFFNILDAKVIRNDILVFESPIENDQVLVKRCIGLPGETIDILNGEVFIDHRIILRSVESKKEFEVINRRTNDRRKLLLTRLDLRFLESNKSVVVSYRKNKMLPFFTLNKYVNVDSLEQITIPKIGFSITLNDSNYDLYKGLFSSSENVPILRVKDKFMLNGKEIKQYTFTNDYYFLLGDNRSYSFDSRNFGFVNKKKILGKLMCIWRC